MPPASLSTDNYITSMDATTPQLNLEAPEPNNDSRDGTHHVEDPFADYEGTKSLHEVMEEVHLYLQSLVEALNLKDDTLALNYCRSCATDSLGRFISEDRSGNVNRADWQWYNKEKLTIKPGAWRPREMASIIRDARGNLYGALNTIAGVEHISRRDKLEWENVPLSQAFKELERAMERQVAETPHVHSRYPSWRISGSQEDPGPWRFRPNV